MHDLAIRNAVIYDGSGAPPVTGDLVVEAGRIVAVGGKAGAAREQVRADGLALAPGIIDCHTHYDAQLTWDGWAQPSPALGVTTVIIGNCGFAVAPCRARDRDAMMRNLCNVEGMSLEALRAGMRWGFETFPEYLALLEGRGVGPNVAAFCGHSAIRTWVMGEAANERAARAEEVAAMATLVRGAMADGAVGFATSTFEGHNGEGGVPMPSLLAEDGELAALVGAMGESGGGTFMLTRGSRTTMPFLESLAAQTGRPVVVAALLHDHTRPDAAFAEFDAIAAAQARGHELYGQVSCCPLTMDFTLRNPYLMESYRAWRPAMKAKGEALARVYADGAFRTAMKAELDRAQGLRAFTGDWSRIFVARAADPAHAALEGRDVASLAAEAGEHPLDRFLDLGLSERLETVFSSLLLNSDEDAVARLLADPHSTIALSDAGAHLTFFCDAGFGLHLYGHWVRERALMPLEAAVHQLTARQAAIYRIPDRGRLAVGAHADLMLFDPATIARTANRRVHDLPAGASRLVCAAEGLHGVWVNGARVAAGDGPAAGAPLPGRVIRRFER